VPELVGQAASFENGLNLLSVTSAPKLALSALLAVWGHLPRTFSALNSLLFSGQKLDLVMAGGGANPAGALGHIGAVLELAEQIRNGVLPDPDHIILPQGNVPVFV
jgi:1-aminocyclopropane-1-carboxylate deaminase/D-cysteine desulfhydrase-like pyridoxal-dependent ACC family enzyme